MVELQLTRGHVAIVDDCDADLSAWKWRALVTDGVVYAVRSARAGEGKRGSTILLHRVVAARVGLEIDGACVDHVNHDGLDNRRKNLRAASNTENCRYGRRRKNNSSGYHGVCFSARDNGWLARIRVDRKKIHLGTFKDPEQAARAYDEAARRFHGEFASLNFNEERCG